MRFVTDDRVVDTGTNKRTMQVICAGLPRCATSSLQAALEGPVFNLEPCMHMAHVVPHADRAQLTIDAMREVNRERRLKMVSKLFDGYAATADFPGVMFIGDLMDLYPDAKVILNKRKNGKVWAESITGALKWFGSRSYLYICYLWKVHRLHVKMQHTARDESMRIVGKNMNMDADFYDFYMDWVRSEAKKRGRTLLEWEAGDGYAPICKFLGKEEPPKDLEFPHVNDQATIQMLKYIFMAQGIASWLALGGTLWAGWTFGPGLYAKALPLVQGFLSR